MTKSILEHYIIFIAAKICLIMKDN